MQHLAPANSVCKPISQTGFEVRRFGLKIFGGRQLFSSTMPLSNIPWFNQSFRDVEDCRSTCKRTVRMFFCRSAGPMVVAVGSVFFLCGEIIYWLLSRSFQQIFFFLVWDGAWRLGVPYRSAYIFLFQLFSMLSHPSTGVFLMSNTAQYCVTGLVYS